MNEAKLHLDANAASGYLEVAEGAYQLPPEQAMALTNQDSPVFVAPDGDARRYAGVETAPPCCRRTQSDG